MINLANLLSILPVLVATGDDTNLAIPAIALLSFACSALTTWLLSFLPGSKYLVGTE